MPKAEPQGEVPQDDAFAFEKQAANDLRHKLVRAGWATAVLVGTVLVLTPFLYGHSLHAHWQQIGRPLLLVAMGEFLWLLISWGFVHATWQNAREVRRNFANLD